MSLPEAPAITLRPDRGSSIPRRIIDMIGALNRFGAAYKRQLQTPNDYKIEHRAEQGKELASRIREITQLMRTHYTALPGHVIFTRPTDDHPNFQLYAITTDTMFEVMPEAVLFGQRGRVSLLDERGIVREVSGEEWGFDAHVRTLPNRLTAILPAEDRAAIGRSAGPQERLVRTAFRSQPSA